MTVISSLTGTSACPATSGTWPTTRILFALAGTITVLSAALTATVSPWFLLLTTFAGLNQLLYVATGACPVSLVIERLRQTSPSSPGSRVITTGAAAGPGMLNAHHHEET